MNFVPGHSRTVIGIEILKTGDELLLILDPGVRKNTMEKALSAPNPFGTLNILRKSLYNMKDRQYQIATVVGIVGSQQEYQVRRISNKNVNLTRFISNLIRFCLESCFVRLETVE